MHMTSEGTKVTVDPGAQLHYEVFDYVNSALYKTHNFKMSDERSISATELRADGVTAVDAIHATHWGVIEFPDSATGSCWGGIPSPYDWADGNITGIDLTFAMDAANTSDDVRFRITMIASAVGGATGTPAIDESFTVTVNDLANRVNKETLTFAAPLAVAFNDVIMFRVQRVGGDGADTAAGNLDLMGVNILYESDGPTAGSFDVPPPFI
jgi:hypothetical protein